ncbi:MAG TPA: hypothetical protein VG944_24740 [Fimbriimonas sp.]|nr:hypothetical protein [Fimbriimonas sp.]
MIASVRVRNVLALPRLAKRALKAKAPKASHAARNVRQPGFVASFEQMLDHQVRLILNGFDD